MFPHEKKTPCGGCPVTISGNPYTYYDEKPFCTLYCYMNYKWQKLGYLKPKEKETTK